MDEEPITLREFIQNSNLEVSKIPPWVHSTSVNKLYKIKKSGKLLALPCNVFRGEKLCYCFVGRPAYKQEDMPSVQSWQLPMAFVVRFQNPPPIKRIFPFDSGAFINNRLPNYITDFDIDGYNLASDTRNIGRLISLLYGNPKAYFERKAVGFEELKKEHDFTLQHMEISAVHKLALDNSNRQFDDRAATIEISLGEDITLAKENLIGVVMPEEVKRVKHLVDWLRSVSSHIEYYPHYPTSLYTHYGNIYQAVEKIFKKAGIRL